MTEPVARTEDAIRQRTQSCGRWYDDNLRLHERWATALEHVLRRILSDLDRKMLPVQVRIKGRESFVEKCLRPDRADSSLFRYSEPQSQIRDVVGARVTLYLLGDAAPVRAAVQRDLRCEDEDVKGAGDARIPGYQGEHFSVSFTPDRLNLPEFREFTGLWAELQVRTVLQHTWAEIQHDLIYKPQIPIPVDVQRRLVGLAGILEVADREFESVTQDFESYLQEGDDDAVPSNTEVGTDGTLRELVEQVITPNVPPAPPDWFGPFQANLDTLGLTEPDALVAVLSQPEDIQKTVVDVLAQEDDQVNQVQVANALLLLHFGDDYVDGQARTFNASPQRLERMRTDARRRRSAFMGSAGA